MRDAGCDASGCRSFHPMAQPFSVSGRAFLQRKGGISVRALMNFLLGLGIDLGWGFLLFVLIVLCVLFSTGIEARFIYTDF